MFNAGLQYLIVRWLPPKEEGASIKDNWWGLFFSSLCLAILLAAAPGCSHDLDSVGKPCPSAGCPAGQYCAADNTCVPGSADLGLDAIPDKQGKDVSPADRSADAPVLGYWGIDVSKADLLKPDGPGSDGPGADAPTPDGALADAPLPDAPLPDQPKPDQLKPDLLQPDLLQVDAPPPDQNLCATKCNDGKTCTLDTCGDAGCVNTLITGYCLIYGACFKKGAAMPGDSCKVCDPGFGAKWWAPAKGCVITLAGTSSYGHADGPAAAATFKSPTGVATDTDGTVYVADKGNDLVRKIKDGVVSTIAGKYGTKTLDGPWDVAVGSQGEVYISEYYKHVIKVVSGGTLKHFAGHGSHTFYVDGPAAKATFFNPVGIVSGPLNTLYVVDSKHHSIRSIKSQTVSTIAGVGGTAGSTNGGALTSKFMYPLGLDLGGSGRIYIADSQNNMIRRLYLGQVSTVVGTGKAGSTDGGGVATAATVNWPSDVAVNRATGEVYIVDSKNHRIRLLKGTSMATLNKTWSGFKDGLISSAMFKLPYGAFFSKAGYLYIADQGNNRVRALRP